MAVYHQLEKLTEAAKKIEGSLKYQVLIDETAIVGVCKQEDKATGEMIESKIEFGRQAIEE